MMIQQYMLGRPEIREFLCGRETVPDPEPWMGLVDTMKSLQGWTDVPVLHFRNLAVYGEQILLSIRYGDWVDVIDQDRAQELGAVLAAGGRRIRPHIPGRHRADGLNNSRNPPACSECPGPRSRWILPFIMVRVRDCGDIRGLLWPEHVHSEKMS